MGCPEPASTYLPAREYVLKPPILPHLQVCKPKDFAMQINLHMENCWGIVRAVIDLCLKLDEGKYIIVKEPNKPVMRLYSVPENAFEQVSVSCLCHSTVTMSWRLLWCVCFPVLQQHCSQHVCLCVQICSVSLQASYCCIYKQLHWKQADMR